MPNTMPLVRSVSLIGTVSDERETDENLAATITESLSLPETEMTDNLDDLLDALPSDLADALSEGAFTEEYGELVEIVLDLGRRPEARFERGEAFLAERDITREDLAHVSSRIGEFGEDNRAGIERTLHRISAIRNRRGDIVGLTCRIGRAVFGTIQIISDLIASGENVLLLGRPGVGKTTMLRETARVLADEYGKRVVVVDTSNEIAGDGDIPHPGIGRARRMQVPRPTQQHAVMIEAVENHMPEVIVIDEIGTELEASAARTIAERGVQLIGTAHGNTLENLMMNPTLVDLIGGIQSVTLSDEEARRRGTQKSILERKAPPTFGTMVEIVSRNEVVVHRDVASTVDSILRGVPIRSESRRRNEDGDVEVISFDEARRNPAAAKQQPNQNGHRSRGGIVDLASRQLTPAHRGPHRVADHGDAARRDDEAMLALLAESTAAPPDAILDHEAGPGGSLDFVPTMPKGRGTESKPLRFYPFGVSRNRLELAIQQLHVPAVIVRDLRDADMVITLKNYYRRKAQPLREAENRGTPVYVLRSNTATQMENVLSGIFPDATARRVATSGGATDDAYAEAEDDGDDDRDHGYAFEDRPNGVQPARSANKDVVTQAMVEAENAITSVMNGANRIVALEPQGAYIRRLQHQLADRYNIGSRSRGREPYRHVEIYRQEMQ